MGGVSSVRALLVATAVMVGVDAGVALAQTGNGSPDAADAGVIDLTTGLGVVDDLEAPQAAVPEDEEPLDHTPPRASLSRQDPAGVRLTTIGLDGGAIAALDRTMWRNTPVDRAIRLIERLPVVTGSATINELVFHVMTGRALPPAGATGAAETYLQKRFDWLDARGRSFALAAFARQLPDEPKWSHWKQFLIEHDLITRNDDEACALAEAVGRNSDDIYWHQVLGFCLLRSGQTAKADFQLDLLEARGLDDALFLELMRHRLDDSPIDGIDQIKPTALNVALMDSENYLIDPDVRGAMPHQLSQSLDTIDYLNPETRYLQHGITYRYQHKPTSEQIDQWRLIPDSGVEVTTAIAQFTDNGTARDALAIASDRVMAWHSLMQLDDVDTRLELTLIALGHDAALSGAEALIVWAPHLQASITDTTNDALRQRAAGLLAIAGYPLPADIPANLQNQAPQNQAWSSLEQAVMQGEVGQEIIRQINGYDAIPLLEAAGITIKPLDEVDLFSSQPPLAMATTSLPYPDLLQLAAIAAADHPAETVLMVAAIVQERPLYQLTRDDAAKLVGALHEVGLVNESRRLALEIIRAWGVYRNTRNAHG